MALNTTEMAEKLGTTPKTLRRFLRADVKASGGEVGVDTPGKGKRYTFEKNEVSKIRKQFAEWQAAQKASEPQPAATAPTATE